MWITKIFFFWVKEVISLFLLNEQYYPLRFNLLWFWWNYFFQIFSQYYIHYRVLKIFTSSIGNCFIDIRSDSDYAVGQRKAVHLREKLHKTFSFSRKIANEGSCYLWGYKDTTIVRFLMVYRSALKLNSFSNHPLDPF